MTGNDQNSAFAAGGKRRLTAHHLFILAVCLSAAALLAWSWYGRLEVVALAPGRVIPGGKVKTVQHLEGGIVRDILVHEGDRVSAGQTLMVLARTDSFADVASLTAAAAARRADIIRLEAEMNDAKTLHFPREFAAKNPAICRQTRALFRSRLEAQNGEQEVLRRQLEQRTKKIAVMRVRIKANEKTLALVNKQLALSRDLLKEELTTSYKQLDLERQSSSLDGEVRGDRAALEEAGAAIAEMRVRLQGSRLAFHSQAAEKLQKVREELKAISIRRGKFSDNLARTEITSPVNGMVKTMYIVTRGGVVRPGMAVLDIVPDGKRLLIEARLPVEEIGYVRRGQRARVRLASGDARRFGALPGRVVFVSPDATVDENKRPFYIIHVNADADRFDNGFQSYRLSPGLRVVVSIHIGDRSVLEYLLGPFLNSFTFAMAER